MAIELIKPIDENTARAIEESAKALGKGIDLVGGLGAYLARALGGVPESLVGLLIGDWLVHQRVRNWQKLNARTKEILEGRAVKEPYAEVSPAIAVPLIEAAINEDREELADLWAKLLAAALDPRRKNTVRQNIIETLKQLEPLDALILEVVFDQQGAAWTLSGRDYLAKRFGIQQEEVLVSFENLRRLGCISFPQAGAMINPIAAPMGQLLIRAVH
jgi:hypothetical protein